MDKQKVPLKFPETLFVANSKAEYFYEGVTNSAFNHFLNKPRRVNYDREVHYSELQNFERVRGCIYDWWVAGYPFLMETNGQSEPISYFVQLSPWQRRLWRLTHTHGIFEILAWLNCSVPGFSGHFRRLLNPGMKYRNPLQ
jgi:hypothetical protein